MSWRARLKRYLTPEVYNALSRLDKQRASAICEIRLYTDHDAVCVFPWGSESLHICLSAEQMNDQLAALTGYALYRFERQLAEGYIPLENGCRAGICGRMTREADGVWRMTQVSSICLRISRCVPGAAKSIYPYLVSDQRRVGSILLFGSPGCGKTTVLRDAAQYLAGNCGLRVSVVDEREELFSGKTGFSYGIDVLTGCDKTKGIMMLLRTMSPEIIICDEIGSADDADAIDEAARCGVAVLATAHADSIQTLCRRTALARIVSGGVFDLYVLLRGMGTMAAIWDSDKNLIWEEAGNGQLGHGDDGDDCGQRNRILAL